MEPVISVVLPTRDAAGTLRRAVASILAQRQVSLELVVIDDGSTDETPQLLKQLAAMDRRLRCISIPRRGLVPALEAGIDAARGSLIARMDADDEAHPDRLSRQQALLDHNPDLGLVGCLVEFGGDARSAEGYARHVTWTNSLQSHESISLGRFVECPLPHPSIVFRRQLIHRFGSYREGPFPEDYELILRWLDAGVRMQKVPERLLRWNDAPGRLSRTDPRYAPEAFYSLKADYLARWLSKNNPHHPEVVIWGAGRETRRRAEKLLNAGIEIVAWVDIDPRKTGRTVAARPVWRPNDLPPPGTCFVASYVGRHGARELIAARLREAGYTLGEDFILAA